MTSALKTHRVLLVEDSAADVFLLETSVEMGELPLQLYVAEDGLAAIQQLERDLTHGELPELILLDLNMPRMNGFEVLESLNQRQEYQGVPVVVLTTSASSIDREKVLALGARAFVTKPYLFDGVVAFLENVTSALQGQLAWRGLS